VKAEQERAKSIILTAVFDDYVEKLRRMRRTSSSTVGAAPASARFSIEKISDLKPSEIKIRSRGASERQFQFQPHADRAVLNHAVKRGLLKSNPASQLEAISCQPAEKSSRFSTSWRQS
jgi:site-specific recombinase XerC